MLTDPIQHLINLKFYSDFKKSGLNSFELFWEMVSNGRNPQLPKGRFILYKPDLSDYCDSVDSHFIDYVNLYTTHLEDSVIQRVELSNTKIPDPFEPSELKEFILDNHDLNGYIDLVNNLFDDYFELIGNIPAIRFMNTLAMNPNLGQTDVKKTDVNSSSDTNPYPHLFTDKGYKLFNALLEHFDSGSQNDLSFIYRQLNEEGLILAGLRPIDFVDFLAEHRQIFITKVVGDTQCFTEARLKRFNLVKGLIDTV